jgi:hypothetical protein
MIDDPLSVREAYTDGVLRDTAVLVVPNAIQRDDMKTLAEYERLVRDFRVFFTDAEAEAARWEQSRARLPGRAKGKEGRRDPTEKGRSVEPAHPPNPRQSSGR